MSGGREGRGAAWLTPARLARLVALTAAAASLTAGALGLMATAPPGAIPADALAAAGDGAIHVTGTVDRVWVDGGASVTHVVLRGAGLVDLLVAGAEPLPYGPGTFVEVRGMKEGPAVLASSITAAVDPVDRAAPWLGAAAVLLSALVAGPLSAAARTRRGRAGRPTVLGRLAATVRRGPRMGDD